MRHLSILIIHFIATVLKLVRPSGVRAVVAESVLAKHQLLILNRSTMIRFCRGGRSAEKFFLDSPSHRTGTKVETPDTAKELATDLRASARPYHVGRDLPRQASIALDRFQTAGSSVHSGCPFSLT
jgi:hypothetical protein